MESSYEMELCVGKKFKSKYECFTFFKHLMSKENFKLINNLTNDIPLNKINNILNKYNYVWINIIDKFLKKEKERHTTARILQYEEQTELIQFVKTIKTTYNDIFNIYDFDKQLFNIEESTKLIVLIGKEENIVSKNLKKEYSFHKENESYNTNIIEIYTQDYNDTINL